MFSSSSDIPSSSSDANPSQSSPHSLRPLCHYSHHHPVPLLSDSNSDSGLGLDAVSKTRIEMTAAVVVAGTDVVGILAGEITADVLIASHRFPIFF